MEAGMVDEETKQLLRDILATQREQLALSQRNAEENATTKNAYAADSTLYHQSIEEWQVNSSAFRWADIIRATTMAGVVLLLGYVVFFGSFVR